jgi:hypothetical protein
MRDRDEIHKLTDTRANGFQRRWSGSPRMIVVPAIKTINTKITDTTLPITANMRRASAMPFLVGLVRYLSIMADELSRWPSSRQIF